MSAIRLAHEGRGAEGLIDIGPVVDTGDLEEGSGARQHALEAFRSPDGTLQIGVWHATPFVTKLAPYSVTEYMMVLDGGVVIRDENGTDHAFNAGDEFLIPKGAKVSWRQSQEIRKIYAILDDPAEQPGANPQVIRLDPAAPLNRIDDLGDPAQFVGGQVPNQHQFPVFENDRGLNVGYWDCTPMHKHPVTFPRTELMILHEGRVTIGDGSGHGTTFGKGDAFVIPQGASYRWDSDVYVRKTFVIKFPAG